MSQEKSEDQAAAASLPSYADQKLDRQLRLWGAEGQRALQQTCVVLFGATSAGCEALKNVILPNVGAFLVVDDSIVTDRHLGSNFFIDHDSRGTMLATAVTSRLAELNPDVRALPAKTTLSPTAAAISFTNAQQTSSSSLELDELQQDSNITSPTFWKDITDVLAQHCSSTDKATSVFHRLILITTTAVSESALVKLSTAIENNNHNNNVNNILTCSTIALMHLEAVGLIGSIRVQSPPLFIRHTHPSTDMTVHDLAVTRPFSALQTWFDAHDPANDELFAQNIDHHSHLPWLCIMYHAIRRQREARGLSPTDESVPSTPLDFRDLKRHVSSLARRTAPPQECIEEALSQCKMTIDVRQRMSPKLKELFNDVRAQQPSATDDVIWFVVHGLRVFREKHQGYLPLTGTLPDITTYTHWYSELQVLYRDQAALEAEEVYATALAAMHQANVEPNSDFKALVADVCMHCWELTHVVFNSIAAESECGRFCARMFASSTDDTSFLSWYAVLRAQRLFREQYNRAPGDCTSVEDIANEQLWTSDVPLLHELTTQKVLGGAQIAEWTDEQKNNLAVRVREACRYGGGEVISTAAIIGAVAGQEIIKLAQRRRVPANDAVVYDGNSGAFGTIVAI